MSFAGKSFAARIVEQIFNIKKLSYFILRLYVDSRVYFDYRLSRKKVPYPKIQKRTC